MSRSTALPPTTQAMCDKCRQRAATIEFVDDTFAKPPVRLLLCEPCAEAERGRLVGRMIASAAKGVPPGFPDNLSDDQLRDLIARFRDSANWE